MTVTAEDESSVFKEGRSMEALIASVPYFRKAKLSEESQDTFAFTYISLAKMVSPRGKKIWENRLLREGRHIAALNKRDLASRGKGHWVGL